MNILHVLSQFEVTGAEVYAATLASEQQKQGHTVILISDTLHVPFRGVYIQQAIGNRSYRHRWKNIRFLIRFIRENNIHVVHAHSRAASWVCFFAVRFTKTVFISTVHGRQHLHFSSTTWNVYGKNIIAISETLKDHLVEELGLNQNHISQIANGLNIESWLGRSRIQFKSDLFNVPDSGRVLLLVGRLSGPKGDIVRFFLKEVFPNLARQTNASLFIISGMQVPDDISQLIHDAQQTFGSGRLGFKDFQKDIFPYLSAADIVVGAGRVAMEALILGKPTVAFGESTYEGLITEENFYRLSESNFGDTGPHRPLDKESIVREFTALFQRPFPENTGAGVQQLALKMFDIRNIEKEVSKIYQSGRARLFAPASLPVLMFHRVVPEPPLHSKYGLWITTSDFERQLFSLRRRRYSPITLEHYRDFLIGKTMLPAKPVILTFDDGYRDNFTHAFPLLKKFAFPAVVFLVTGRRRTNFWDADEPQELLMCDAEIREMSAAGIEFGSHTVSHADLTCSSAEELRCELMDSKKTLEDLLGKSIISLAYPYGKVNKAVKTAADEAGYSFGVAADSGPLIFYDDFFEIRRSQVFPWTGSFGFWKKTQPWYLRYKQKKK